MTAITAYINGEIHTQDKSRPRAEAVLVRDGIVVAVGSNDEVLGSGEHEALIDLGGRFMMPGFIDAHLHFAMGADYLNDVGVRDAKTMAEVLTRLAAYAEKFPDKKWIVGQEFSYGYPDLGPTGFHKSAFDAVVKDRPVYFRSGMAHAAWANSKALELAGITRSTADPEGGIIERDADGEPTGWLKESAMKLVEKLIPPASRAEKRAAIEHALSVMASLGLTRVQSAGFDDDIFEILNELQEEGGLTCRISLSTVIDPKDDIGQKLSAMLKYREQYHSDFLSFDVGKFFLDGVLESHTAYMPRGYADRPEEKGVILWEPSNYNLAVSKVQAAGFQVWTHAIGEGAINIALNAYEADGERSRARRPRIEHSEIPSEVDVARYAMIGAIASFQPSMIYPKDEWLGMEGVWQPRVGDDAMTRAFPIRSIKEAGGAIAFGTDWPIVNLNPLLGIRKAVLRKSIDNQPVSGWVEPQAISIEEAVEAYTLGAAYAGHREEHEGSISPGKFADLIVLSGNPFKCEPDQLPTLRVEATIVNGELVNGKL
ncbi:amidohydrolase (plasmid) [Phyllobacteriaceae bacterium JZ32]